MRHHLSKLRSRLRQVFFGPPYHPADHAALSPRGSQRGIRTVLVVVGSIWLSLVLIDNLARPWQRRVKSWQFFQGVREFSEVPNLPREIEPMPPPGNMASGLGVARVARPYLEAESKTPVYIETDAHGFRSVRSRPPYAIALCGDSFAGNNSLADSLASATGLSTGNQSITGRFTLAISRFLEDWPADYRQAHLVIWEATQRTTVTEYAYIAERRRLLRQSSGHPWLWPQTLLWPANLDLYLNGSSLLKPSLEHMNKFIKLGLLKRPDNITLLGRRDLPAGMAPLLYYSGEESIRPEATPQHELDSIADYIAGVDRDFRQRGQKLVFTIAPEKSFVYPDRLPAGLSARTNYIPGLSQALRQRGVAVVDVSVGLRAAAQARPRTLYYYTSDTHWTPEGMSVAARIIADSLANWQLIPARRVNPVVARQK